MRPVISTKLKKWMNTRKENQTVYDKLYFYYYCRIKRRKMSVQIIIEERVQGTIQQLCHTFFCTFQRSLTLPLSHTVTCL